MARKRIIPDWLDRWFDRHPLVFAFGYFVVAGAVITAISDLLGAFR